MGFEPPHGVVGVYPSMLLITQSCTGLFLFIFPPCAHDVSVHRLHRRRSHTVPAREATLARVDPLHLPPPLSSSILSRRTAPRVGLSITPPAPHDRRVASAQQGAQLGWPRGGPPYQRGAPSWSVRLGCSQPLGQRGEEQLGGPGCCHRLGVPLLPLPLWPAQLLGHGSSGEPLLLFACIS